LRAKQMEDADVHEDKCFLLSLLPSFRQFCKIFGYNIR
jgi:hypothetical protein